MFRTLTIFLAIGVAVALLTGCGKKTQHKKDPAVTTPAPAKPFKGIQEPPPKGDNLMLIVVDTFRADRLGCYGFDKPTTPTIDKIASEGVIFDTFYASSPWTAPSFGSLLTGVSPLLHHTGRWVRRRVKGTIRIGAVLLYPLNPRLSTMAELFSDKETATFASNPFLDPKLGFARGVDHYDQTFNHRPANLVTEHTIEWLKENKDKSFFVMLHYMDLHTPYDPLPQYKKMFVKGDGGRIKTPFSPRSREAMSLHPNKKELDYIKGIYNADVRFVDDQINRLVNHMKRNGLLENTWLVITADHGEEHWDHGGFNHGYQYENEVTRVPLIIRAPGGTWGKGRRVPYSTRMMDLLPTFLELFGKEIPEHIEGKSLLPMLAGDEKADRPCYMEFQLFRKPKYAYFDGRYKIIKPEYGTGAYMYDLYVDPLEKKKLGKRHWEFKRLEKTMERYRHSRRKIIEDINKMPPPETTEPKKEIDSEALSDEAVESLRALGYIE